MGMKPGQKTAKIARKEQRQEELREKLKGAHYLSQIDKCVKEVENANYDVSTSELAARKFVVDTNFRRLAKVLPDLKAIEVAGPDGGAINLVQTVARVIVDPVQPDSEPTVDDTANTDS